VLGAPHVGERSERDLIAAFVDKIAQLKPQQSRHFGSASTTHTPVAYHLWGAIEKGIAGVLRIQKTDRSVGLGDLVHNWVRDRVLDRRADSFLMAMTLRECRFHPNWTPCQDCVNRVSLNLVSFRFSGQPTN
jgi:hypothetical protein